MFKYPDENELMVVLAKVLKILDPFKENIEIAKDIDMFFRQQMGATTTKRRGAYLMAQMQQGKTSAALLSFLRFIAISTGSNCLHLKNVLFLYIINISDVELLKRTKDDVVNLVNVFNKVVEKVNNDLRSQHKSEYLLYLNLLDSKTFAYKKDFINICVDHEGGEAILGPLMTVKKGHGPKIFIVNDECHFGINKKGRYDSFLKVLNLDFTDLSKSLKKEKNITLLSMSATPFSTVISDLSSGGDEWQVFCLDESPKYFSLEELRRRKKIHHLQYKFAFNLFELEFIKNSLSVKLCPEVEAFLKDNSLDVLAIWTDNAKDINSYYRKHKESFENACKKVCGKQTVEPIKVFKNIDEFDRFIKNYRGNPSKKKFLLIFDSFSPTDISSAQQELSNKIGSLKNEVHTKNQVNDWFIDMLISWESQGNSSYMVIRESQDNIVKIIATLGTIGIAYEVYEARNAKSIGKFLSEIQSIPPGGFKKVLFIKQSFRAGQTFGTCEHIEYWIESDSTLSAKSTDDVTVQSIGRLCGYGGDKGKTEIYCDISKVQIYIDFFAKTSPPNCDFMVMPRDPITYLRAIDGNYLRNIKMPSTRYNSSGQISNKFRLSIKYILSREDFLMLEQYVKEFRKISPSSRLKSGLSVIFINKINKILGVLTDQLDNPLLDYYDNPKSSSRISQNNNLTRTHQNKAKRDLPESLNGFIYNKSMNLDFGNVCGIWINGDRNGNPDKVPNIHKSLDDLLVNLKSDILTISKEHSNLNFLEIGICPSGGKQIFTYSATNKVFQPKIKQMVAKLELQLKNLKLNQKDAREVKDPDGIVFLLELVTITTYQSPSFINRPIHQP